MARDGEHPVFDRAKGILRLFFKRPDIVDLGSEEKPVGIYVANHSAADGPFTYVLFFPFRFVPWGAHEMCGNYRERWHYLYDIFYQQKLGWGKVRAFAVATPFAVISRMVYKGAELLPTYRDQRLVRTIRKSLDMLRCGRNIMVFPEVSDDGYHELLQDINGGFVLLAKRFREATGTDVPIYPVCYCAKRNRIVIDRPHYLSDVIARLGNNSNRELAMPFMDRINQLRLEHMGE